MRVAIAYNERVNNDPEQAVFANPGTVTFVAKSLERAGHEAVPIEASGPVDELMGDLERSDPDIVFNLAEGWSDSGWQAFYTCLYGRLGLPFTGSGPAAQLLTRNKHLTKVAAADAGVSAPASRLAVADRVPDLSGLRYPVIVKPNNAATSQGITQDSVVDDAATAAERARRLLTVYPDGVLVEEYVHGREITVGYLAGLRNGQGGVLRPTELLFEATGLPGRRHRILDHDVKHRRYLSGGEEPELVRSQTPASLSADTVGELQRAALAAVTAVGCDDIARVDFRLDESGVPHLLEVNALPGLDPELSLHKAAALEGLDPHGGVVLAVLGSAALRHGLMSAEEAAAAIEIGSAGIVAANHEERTCGMRSS